VLEVREYLRVLLDSTLPDFALPLPAGIWYKGALFKDF
jgi:hypothetical protein